jgi:hypothetical protein
VSGCPLALTGPDPEDEGSFTAELLTPTGYPFTVSSVRYELAGATQGVPACNSTLAHEVRVFIVSVDDVALGQLPLSPSALGDAAFQLMTVPASDGDGTVNRPQELALDPPLVLTEGQGLAVAVEHSAAGTDYICTLICTADPVVRRSFTSVSAAEPYSWADLTAQPYRFPGNLRYSAVGQ